MKRKPLTMDVVDEAVARTACKRDPSMGLNEDERGMTYTEEQLAGAWLERKKPMKAVNEITAAEFRAKTKKQPRFRVCPPAERTEDGIVFRSKSELARYRELKAERKAGNVAWFLYEPCFHLAGVKYHADFLVAWTLDQPPRLLVYAEEVKPLLRGSFRREALRTYERNAKQVEAIYGIHVNLIEMGTNGPPKSRKALKNVSQPKGVCDVGTGGDSASVGSGVVGEAGSEARPSEECPPEAH